VPVVIHLERRQTPVFDRYAARVVLEEEARKGRPNFIHRES